MSRRHALTLLLTLMTLLTVCRPTDAEYAAVDAWLLCDDCTTERAQVQAIGSTLTHTLDQALRGPSPGRIGNKVVQLTENYAMLPSPGVSESIYVSDAVGNYVARYQQRAALSLGDIGTGRAREALRRASDSAIARNYRSDVIDVVERVLTYSVHDPFGGTFHPSLVNFGDTVHVRRDSGPTWDGDEFVLLQGAPVADSVSIIRWGDDSLAFIAATGMGSHIATIGGLGSQEDTQRITLDVVAPGYMVHSPVSAPLVTSIAFPQTHYLELPSTARDTMDFFRLEPAANLTVTAHVVMRLEFGATARAPVSLRWRRCGAPILDPAASGSITGIALDERGSPLGGALIMVVGTAVTTMSAPTGNFSVVMAPTTTASLRISRLGYRPQTYSVQTGADTVRIGAVAAAAKPATALVREASTVTIPSGGCRLLQLASTQGEPRVIRLRLTSP
jgi:hypothetical protein